MKDINGKLNDDNLEEVNGGFFGMNTIFNKETDVRVNNAIKDDSTIMQSKLLAGEARQTEKDPLADNTGAPGSLAKDPFGTNLSAGSGLA